MTGKGSTSAAAGRAIGVCLRWTIHRSGCGPFAGVVAPTAIVNLLNHYFSAVTAPIVSNNGIVDKYIGDGLLAFWVAPFSPGDTHAGRGLSRRAQAAGCLAALAELAPGSARHQAGIGPRG
jgi:adenylate cyclase